MNKRIRKKKMNRPSDLANILPGSEEFATKLSKSSFGAEGFTPTEEEMKSAAESERRYLETRKALRAKYGSRGTEAAK